ncbi:MAG: GTPase [Nanoarchaeota archaeon]|nr:GTPase [Nanoarchaeota archaeon]
MRVRYSFSSRRTRNTENMRKQRGKYPMLILKIIQDSDIILEVLDARFIEETRNPEIEEQIKEQNKKLIYVLNKSDLLLEKKKKINLDYSILVSCKERRDIKKLRDLIKILSKKIKKSFGEKIIVGIIGYPNTGKSSLINLLIGKSSAGVGSEAGFTKGIQKLRLDENILILDSPGVIPEKQYSHTEKEKISKQTIAGGRSFSQVKEPEIVVAKLISAYPNVLEKFYNIQANGDSEILMEELGRKKGFLKKGGLVDEDRTAKYILRDWQTGEIKI